ACFLCCFSCLGGLGRFGCSISRCFLSRFFCCLFGGFFRGLFSCLFGSFFSRLLSGLFGRFLCCFFAGTRFEFEANLAFFNNQEGLEFTVRAVGNKTIQQISFALGKHFGHLLRADLLLEDDFACA